MTRIAISYRRDDSGVITGRIFDRLAARYGRESVFRDIENIPAGVDFRKYIKTMLGEADVVIAIIGQHWIGPQPGESRLASGADPVRVEIEATLRNEVPLIPVLVQGAVMPPTERLPESMQSFAYLNALAMDGGMDFDLHMDRLTIAIDRILGEEVPEEDEPAGPVPLHPEDAWPRPSPALPQARAVAIEDALRLQIEELTIERDGLCERAETFAMELKFAAEEAAATQRQLDEEEFEAELSGIRKAHAQRMLGHHLGFAALTAAVIGLLVAVAILWWR